MKAAPTNFKTLRHRRGEGGFLLLESMIAVFMFAVGLIALGECVRNCIRAESFKREDSRARQVLANYMAMVDTDVLPISEATTEELKEPYEGLTLHMEKEPLKLVNEKDQELFGLFKVNMEVSWKTGQDKSSRSLSFIIYPRKNPAQRTTQPNQRPASD